MQVWPQGGHATSTDPGRASHAPGSSLTLRQIGGNVSATEPSRNTAPAGSCSARSARADDAPDLDSSSLTRATFLVFKKKADALAEENARLQSEHATLQATLRQEREAASELSGRMREAEVRQVSLLEEIGITRDNEKAQRQRGDRLEQIRDELEGSLIERETEISNMQLEKTRLSLEMDQAAKFSSHNLATAKHLKESVHRLEDEKQSLQRELEQQGAIAAERARLEAELSALQAQFLEQREQTAKIEGEAREAEVRQAELEERIRELSGREETQRSRGDGLEARNSALQESLASREADIARMREEQAKLEQELGEASRRQAEGVATLRGLEENIRLMQRDKEALQQELQRQAVLTDENVQLQAKLEELQTQMQAQLEQVGALLEQARRAEAQQAALREEVQEACAREQAQCGRVHELQRINGTLELSVASREGEKERLQQNLTQQAMEGEDLLQQLQGRLAETQRSLAQAMEWYTYLSQQVEALREAKLLEAINQSVNLHIAVPKVTLSFTSAPPSSVAVADGLDRERIQAILEREIFCYFEPLWVSLDTMAMAPDGTSKQAYSTRMLTKLTEAVKGYISRCQQADIAANGAAATGESTNSGNPQQPGSDPAALA